MNLDAYKKNILFQNMSDEDITEALKCLNSYKRSYQKNEIIYHAGSSTTFMGLILNGSVIVERNDAWGNRTILTKFNSGDFFAESYAMNPAKVIPVDIIAQEPILVVFLEINKITTDSCSSHRVINKLTANLLKISLQKNMFLSNRSFLLSAKTMREKIFGYLDNISLQNHSNEFDIPFDRQQLAEFLKIDRTSLSKELSKMQSEGLITYKKNHFIIDTDQRTKSHWNKSNGCVISC